MRHLRKNTILIGMNLFRRTLPVLAVLLALAAPQFVVAQTILQTTPAPDPAESDRYIAEFQKIESAWTDAINTKNQFTLENILSPQFVGISATGQVTNRDQQIATLFRTGIAPAILTQRVITARVYAGANGTNFAVVSGTYALKTKDGKDVDDEQGIFTHIYLHNRTQWQCINAQRTIIINQLLPKTKLAPPKK